MNTGVIAVLVILALLVAAGIGVWLYQRRRTDRLRRQFGPEYDRTVRERANLNKAEAELEARAQRVANLQIRNLDPTARARFAREWREVQAHFADDPHGAVADADRLVAETMQARGYPVGSFEQSAADISVDHPRVVDNYRRAHEIAQRSGHSQTTTEDLRQAIVCYRALFEELLGEPITVEEGHDGRAA